MSNPISAQAYQSTSAMDVEMAQEEGMNVGNVQEVTGMKRGWSETDNPGPTDDFKVGFKFVICVAVMFIQNDEY